MNGYNVKQFHVSHQWQSNAYEVMARVKNDDGKYAFIRGEFTQVPYDDSVVVMSTPHLMHLRDDEAQNLMDALWNVGIRPAQGSGTGAHVEAMKYHLEDMRRLVFDKMKGQK